MKYTVQQVKLLGNEVLEVRDVFQSDDHDEAMKYWMSYASGLNDYEEPHSNQNFTVAVFFRIIHNN